MNLPFFLINQPPETEFINIFEDCRTAVHKHWEKLKIFAQFTKHVIESCNRFTEATPEVSSTGALL